MWEIDGGGGLNAGSSAAAAALRCRIGRTRRCGIRAERPVAIIAETGPGRADDRPVPNGRID